MLPRITQSSYRPGFVQQSQIEPWLALRHPVTACMALRSRRMYNHLAMIAEPRLTSFCRHEKSIESGCQIACRGQVIPQPRLHLSMSFSWVFLGGLLSSIARLRFPSYPSLSRIPILESRFPGRDRRSPSHGLDAAKIKLALRPGGSFFS